MAAKNFPLMMQQYMDIKEAHQDCILFFRLGDFYEMFSEDAKLVSRELELTLTGKKPADWKSAHPMCGVPFHSADTYIARLIEKGHKVAICEQTEDPAAAKGLVKREVIRIVTPGTVLSSNMLKENENNYIASYRMPEKTPLGLHTVTFPPVRCISPRRPGAGHDQREYLVNELVRINAREVLVSSMEIRTVSYRCRKSMRPVTERVFQHSSSTDSYYGTDAVARRDQRGSFDVSAAAGDRGRGGLAGGSRRSERCCCTCSTPRKTALGHIAFLNTYTAWGKDMSLEQGHQRKPGADGDAVREETKRVASGKCRRGPVQRWVRES